MSIWAAIEGAGEQFGRQLEDKRRLAMELEKEETLAEREENRRQGRIKWDQQNQATGNFAYDDEAGAKTPLSKEGTPIGAPIPMTASEIAARELELRKMQSEGRDIDVKDRTRDIQLGAGVGSIEHGITAEEQKRLSALGYQGALAGQASAQAGKARRETELLGMEAPGKPATASTSRDIVQLADDTFSEISGLVPKDSLTGNARPEDMTEEGRGQVQGMLEWAGQVAQLAKDPDRRNEAAAELQQLRVAAIMFKFKVPKKEAEEAVANGATLDNADRFLAVNRGSVSP